MEVIVLSDDDDSSGNGAAGNGAAEQGAADQLAAQETLNPSLQPMPPAQEDVQEMVTILRSIFPHLPQKCVGGAANASGGDINVAVSILLDGQQAHVEGPPGPLSSVSLTSYSSGDHAHSSSATSSSRHQSASQPSTASGSRREAAHPPPQSSSLSSPLPPRKRRRVNSEKRKKRKHKIRVRRDHKAVFFYEVPGDYRAYGSHVRYSGGTATIAEIAEAGGVDASDVVTINREFFPGLSAATRVHSQLLLRLPPRNTRVIACLEGDTYSSVAERYGHSPEALARMNRLLHPMAGNGGGHCMGTEGLKAACKAATFFAGQPMVVPTSSTLKRGKGCKYRMNNLKTKSTGGGKNDSGNGDNDTSASQVTVISGDTREATASETKTLTTYSTRATVDPTTGETPSCCSDADVPISMVGVHSGGLDDFRDRDSGMLGGRVDLGDNPTFYPQATPLRFPVELATIEVPFRGLNITPSHPHWHRIVNTGRFDLEVETNGFCYGDGMLYTILWRCPTTLSNGKDKQVVKDDVAAAAVSSEVKVPAVRGKRDALATEVANGPAQTRDSRSDGGGELFAENEGGVANNMATGVHGNDEDGSRRGRVKIEEETRRDADRGDKLLSAAPESMLARAVHHSAGRESAAESYGDRGLRTTQHNVCSRKRQRRRALPVAHTRSCTDSDADGDNTSDTDYESDAGVDINTDRHDADAYRDFLRGLTGDGGHAGIADVDDEDGLMNDGGEEDTAKSISSNPALPSLTMILPVGTISANENKVMRIIGRSTRGYCDHFDWKGSLVVPPGSAVDEATLRLKLMLKEGAFAFDGLVQDAMSGALARVCREESSQQGSKDRSSKTNDEASRIAAELVSGAIPDKHDIIWLNRIYKAAKKRTQGGSIQHYGQLRGDRGEGCAVGAATADVNDGCALMYNAGIAGSNEQFKSYSISLTEWLGSCGALRQGPDCCETSLNRFGGVDAWATPPADDQGLRPVHNDEGLEPSSLATPSNAVSGGDDISTRKAGSFTASPPCQDVSHMDSVLDSVSRTDADALDGHPSFKVTPLVASAFRPPEALRTTLKPYQVAGVRWMVERERYPDRVTLHPLWRQHVASDGQIFYTHRVSGRPCSLFFASPRAGTCGGFLCDEVGLGKSIQVLALALSHRAPLGWAVDNIPETAPATELPIPIKATLIVVPSTLLPQWENEIRTHLEPGSVKYCQYKGWSAGLSVSRPGGRVVVGAPPQLGGGPCGGPAESTSRGRRRRKQTQRYLPGEETSEGASGRRSGAAAGDGDRAGGKGIPNDSGSVPILCSGHGEGDAGFVGPLDGAEPLPPLSECDFVLVSYETIRKELPMTAGPGAAVKSPLAQLGFWRVVLDEAQLVSNTNSKAAILCSKLWRRHAWVVTGTPVNSKVDEVSGLLQFLAHRPFVCGATFRELIQSPFTHTLAGDCFDSVGVDRLRTLLRGLMLRRTKQATEAQLNIPPMQWELRRLSLSVPEHTSYQVALMDLKRSYAAWERAVSAAGNRAARARAAGASLAYEGGRHNARARATARVNGDLTRVRQTICHPGVVTTGRQSSGRGDVIRGLSQTQILERLVMRAQKDHVVALARQVRATAAERIVAYLAAVGRGQTSSSSSSSLKAKLVAELSAIADDLPEDLATAAISSVQSAEFRDEVMRDKSYYEAVKQDVDKAVAWAARGLTYVPERPSAEERSEGHIIGHQQQEQQHQWQDDLHVEQGSTGMMRRSGGRNRALGANKRHGGGALVTEALRLSRRPDNQGASEARTRVRVAERAVSEKVSQLSFLQRQREAATYKKDEDVVRADERGTTGREPSTVQKETLSETTAAFSMTVTQESRGEDSQLLSRANDDDGLGEPDDTCTICLDVLDKSRTWALTTCGHSFCVECVQACLDVQNSCPLCKKHLTRAGVYECDPIVAPSPSPSTDASVLAFGTKIAALLRETARCRESDKHEKMLVFSAWSRLLALTGDALESQGVKTASLAGTTAEAKKTTLRDFAAGRVDVLLVPLFGGSSGAGGGGAAGLNLTEANVAVLLEPALQPGIERQAAGRVHRIGQTKRTRFVRLIAEGTIEERIVEWQDLRMQQRNADAVDAPELALRELVQIGLGRDWEPSRGSGDIGGSSSAA